MLFKKGLGVLRRKGECHPMKIINLANEDSVRPLGF